MATSREQSHGNQGVVEVVILEDDHIAIVGTKLELTQAGIKVLDASDDPTAFLALVKTFCPDVVVMELYIHPYGLVGIDLIREMSEQVPKVKCIVRTHLEKEEILQAAKDVGARAVIRKRRNPPTLKQLVDTVMFGGTYYDHEVHKEQITKLHSEDDISSQKVQKAESPQIDLTEAEMDVLCLIAMGFMAKDIAAIQHLSVNTIKVHVKNIFGKLGVVRASQAAVYGLRKGLITEGKMAKVARIWQIKPEDARAYFIDEDDEINTD